MAVLTLNVPVKEEFLRKIDEAAESESSSREELVNKAIDAYLRRKVANELFSMGDSWSKQYGITEELVGEVIREYKAEQNNQ